jgi:hypothetical protein
MATWHGLTFNFAPFNPLIPPLEGVLTVLQVVQAILEALLDIIKIFLLLFLSPIIAAVVLLLAIIRLLINQIIASGFSILLVHPDFSSPDISGVFNSVSGAYPAFEAKVIGKFYDTADLFRPMYPPGSATAMMILYIGVDSPGNLLGFIFALLNLLNHPVKVQLPAPIAVTARPVAQANGILSSVTQFSSLFTTGQSTQKALAIEWRMPEAPSGIGLPGLIGQITSLYQSFRLPSFIVERTDAANPRGKVVYVTPSSMTLGPSVNPILDRYDFPTVNTKFAVRDDKGNIYRDFAKKIDVSGLALAAGALTGSYQYIDQDPALVAGATYYYRVRAYFGTPSQYLSIKSPSDITSQIGTILFRDQNRFVLKTQTGVTLGKASVPVKGVVPPVFNGTFNPYRDLLNAVRAGILLNFDFPPAQATDSLNRQQQKTGWGTLSVIGGQMGPLKAAVNTSAALQDNFLFQSMTKRVSNSVCDKLIAQPVLLNNLQMKWDQGVSGTVSSVLGLTNPSGVTSTQWSFIGVIGGITPTANTAIETYLALEDSYTVSNTTYPGPLPVLNPTLPGAITASARTDLSNFLRSALALLSYQTSYLHWFSVTLGDLIPPLIPFLNRIEQFILALLKALQDAILALLEIIQTLINKVIQLEQIVQAIIDILSILQINISISILLSTSANGSADQLASDLQSSDNKPGTSPFGLHSGLVLTAGGPGPAFITAIGALGFIFGAT